MNLVNIEDLAKLVGAIVTLGGFALGGYRVYLNSKRVKDAQPLATYRQLTRDLREEVDALREDREEDKVAYSKRFQELEGDNREMHKQISALQTQGRQKDKQIRRLRDRVMYLTDMLRRHAPGVPIDPDPEEETQ